MILKNIKRILTLIILKKMNSIWWYGFFCRCYIFLWQENMFHTNNYYYNYRIVFSLIFITMVLRSEYKFLIVYKNEKTFIYITFISNVFFNVRWSAYAFHFLENVCTNNYIIFDGQHEKLAFEHFYHRGHYEATVLKVCR